MVKIAKTLREVKLKKDKKNLGRKLAKYFRETSEETRSNITMTFI